MRLPKRLILAAGLGAIAARNVLKAPYDLSGKSVLITGGSRGLGLALAREFGARGARLMLMARTEGALESAAAGLRASGVTVQTVTGDLTVGADIERAVEETARVYGGLDVLVHNAGLIQVGPLENMTERDFREIMEVNAFAPLRLTRAALPLLRARQGRVLIVSSIGGKVAVPHLAPYSMSKFAATGLGQALRAELAREGVGVTTVCPFLMQTGSPRHADVKGQQAREYALFATMDNLPLLSLGAEAAARRMVNALVRGEAEVMVGGLALALRYAQALAPSLTADMLALGNRFLPGPGTSSGSVKGADVETPITRNNPIKRAAEEAYNEG